MSGPASTLREIHRLKRLAKDLQTKIEQGPRQQTAQKNKVLRHEEMLKQAQDDLKLAKVHMHEREVELKAGRSTTLALKPEAAEIAMKLAEPTTLSEWSDVFWEIKDAAGRTVWRTSQAEPKALLAPGRYLVRAETRARRIERAIHQLSVPRR